VAAMKNDRIRMSEWLSQNWNIDLNPWRTMRVEKFCKSVEILKFVKKIDSGGEGKYV
jgi:hypothetical protein